MRVSFCISEMVKRAKRRIISAWPRSSRGLPRVLALFVICGLIGALAACTTLRLGYSQGPRLTYWWLDGYADFTSEQAPKVKAAIAGWFDWHRRSQLPQYTAWLAQARQQAPGELSAEQICAWWDRAMTSRDAALQALAPAVAEIAPELTPAQLSHMANKFERNNAKWRDDYAQPDPREREEAAIDRATENMERLYGRLTREQRQWLATQVRAAPWDADRSLAEHEAHQRDTLRTLRQLAQPSLTPAQRLTQAQAWLGRIQTPTNAAATQMRDRSVQHWCQAGADMQHRATASQREHLAKELRGWQDDLASFMVSNPTALATP